MKRSFKDYFEKQIGTNFEKWVNSRLRSGDSIDNIKMVMTKCFDDNYFYKQQFIDMIDYLDSLNTYIFLE